MANAVLDCEFNKHVTKTCFNAGRSNAGLNVLPISQATSDVVHSTPSASVLSSQSTVTAQTANNAIHREPSTSISYSETRSDKTHDPQSLATSQPSLNDSSYMRSHGTMYLPYSSQPAQPVHQQTYGYNQHPTYNSNFAYGSEKSINSEEASMGSFSSYMQSVNMPLARSSVNHECNHESLSYHNL